MYYHIVNRKNRGHERLMEIFEERLHPISVRLYFGIQVSSLDASNEQVQLYLMS